MKREELLQEITKSRSTGTKKRRRRANGCGTIEYRKDRTNAYRVKIPKGTYIGKGGNVQTWYTTLGTYHTRAEAEEALSDYRKSPYVLQTGISTFADLYQVWSAVHFKNLSPNTCRNWRYVYDYCHMYHKMPIRQFSVGTIKDMMETAYLEVKNSDGTVSQKHASVNTKERIKSLCNNMFDYAVERQLVADNPARKFIVTELIHEIEKNRKIKKPFCAEEVQLFWKKLDVYFYMDMILIQIYTGLRPKELCLLELENIHLDQNYMVGGMKTEAGTNRIIPIHPSIKPLIRNRSAFAENECHTQFLFNTPEGKGWSGMTYEKYRHIFRNIMNELGLEGFSPHCARHTFSTQAEYCDVRTLAIKKIMGHSCNSDTTDKYYKHITADYLYREVCKLNFEVEGNDRSKTDQVLREEYPDHFSCEGYGERPAVYPSGDD